MSIYTWSATGGAIISGSSTSQTVNIVTGPDCDTTFKLLLSITAVNGCGSDCERDFNIMETGPPNLSCPPTQTVACDITQLPPYANYAAFIAAGGTATDDCGVDPASFALVDEVSDNNTCPEVITRRYRIVDRCGHADTCSQTIIVNDVTPPVLTCPPAPTAVCNISEITPYADYNTFITAGGSVTDNCGIVQSTFAWVSDVSNGNSCPETVTRTYKIEDLCGNTGTCTQAIIVDDNVPPTITCPSAVSVSADAGVCYATGISLGTPVTADNCGVQSASNNFFILFPTGQVPVGVHTITWTVTDLCGNTASCDQPLTVTDNQPPVILNCPSDVTVYTGPGHMTCDQVASWTPPTATDNCGIPVLTTSHNPGSLFPVGTTQVSYTATDAGGLQTFCVFNVIVIDNTPPTFTQPPNITIYVNSSCTYNAGVAFTGDVTNEFDNCTPTGLQATYSDNTVPGPCPGTFVITRTWTLKDIYGNTAPPLNQIITVADNTKPTLNLPPNKIIQCHESILPSNTGQATGTDNCGGTVTFSYSDVTTPGSCLPAYNILRTWTSTDCSGNFTTGTQLIQVRDNTLPTIDSVDNVAVQCPADIPPIDPGVVHAQDNCLLDTIIFFNEIPYGLENQPGYCPDSLHRIYRVFDACGNYKDAIHRIVVLDKCDCSPCADTLSFHTVDMIGQPNGDTTILDVVRYDKCCDATKDYCAAFNVRIDDDAVGVIITVNGASPSPMDWRIDCNTVVIHGDTICVPGGEFHLFTYCKPGQNANDFRFQSVAGIILAGELTTRVKCNTQLSVEGEITNPEWNSVYPGTYGQYNGYLSCTFCLDPVFIPDPLSPPEIHYEVCGMILPGSCNPTGFVCDTLVVHVLDSITVTLNVNPEAYCQDNIPLLCATPYPIGEYMYEWYDEHDSTGNIVGTDSCYQPLAPGPYSLVIRSVLQSIPCSVFLYNFDVAPDNDPPVVYPPADLSLSCGDPANAQLIQDWLALAYAIDDHTPDLVVLNDYTGIAEFCNSLVTVTFWAIDSCDNIGTATSTITIIDTLPPTISCPPDIIIQADPVTCDVEDPDLGTPTVTDQCPGTPTVNNNAPPAFPPGVTIVMWIATDACGNRDTCWQNVTVIDLIPPTVVCPPDVSAPSDPDSCNAYVIVPAPLVTDPCPYTVTNDYTGTDDASGTYPVGTTVVTWTITGISNNTTTCIQNVTVNDIQPPTIACPPDVFAIAAPPDCQATGVVLGLPLIGDNCPNPLLSWVMTGATTGSGSGYCNVTVFNVGVSTITYTLTDDEGNFATCSFNVTVNDQVPPTIIDCPNDTTAYADPGLCTTYFAIPLPQAIDPCGETVTYSHDSPYGINPQDASGTYPVGLTTVTWTFTDESNNSSYCSHIVTVIDDQLPTITCPSDTSAVAQPPDCQATNVVLEIPTSGDNCPNPSLTWALTGATTGSGSGYVSITTYNVGITTITYTIADASGNTETCSFTVTVTDLVPPVIIDCPNDTTAYADAGHCETYIVIPQPVATDPCGGIVTFTHNSPYGIAPDDASGIYPVGVYNVTWTFTDESGNTSQCLQIITVIDDQLPTIICPVNVQAIAEPPLCEVPDIYLGLPEYYDNCADSLLSWVATGATTGSGSGYVSLTTFNVGVTTITYTVTDASGNTASCTFTVTVFDQVPPTIIFCPPSTTVTATADSCHAYVRVPAPQVVDSCGEIVTYRHDSPYGIDTANATGIYPVGVTTVTWTFTDVSGNTSTCVQSITVLDGTYPELICPASFEWPADYDKAFATNVPVPPPVYSDSCGVETLTWVMTGVTTGNSPPSGINELTLADTLYIGVTTITYTATDPSGNSTTCSFTITITSMPEIACPLDIIANTDPGLCTASLDPGFPTLISGVEPIVWTWEMAGATIAAGIGPIVPNPYPFNEGSTTITWIATNISGADTCQQLIIVTDNEAPSFTPPDSLEFCVYSIFTAIYDGQPEPGADIIPVRPDWYIIDGTIELDITNPDDNCCSENTMTLNWIINFSNGYPSVSGTGQPSLFGPITLWGTTDFTVIVHTITYLLTDCNGNSSVPVSIDITIKPRPDVNKIY
jgi:hypothetical protein